MITYAEVMDYINAIIGMNTEQVIALATVKLSESSESKCKPSVRMVCAYYEDGSFYISTDLRKKKILDIEANEEVGVCGMSWFSFQGVAENLGWVKDEANKDILEKFRSIFDWFQYVGDEDNTNSIILKVRLTSGNIVHSPESDNARTYAINFVDKTVI